MDQDVHIIAPALTGQTVDEAFVLGSAVWLWMHSPMHRETPLLALQDVLPAVARAWFDDHPVRQKITREGELA